MSPHRIYPGAPDAPIPEARRPAVLPPRVDGAAGEPGRPGGDTAEAGEEVGRVRRQPAVPRLRELAGGGAEPGHAAPGPRPTICVLTVRSQVGEMKT